MGFRGVLGPSCASYGPLDKSGALLGPLLGASWAPKGAPRGPQDDPLRPQDGPKEHQKGTQDDQKSIIKLNQKSIAFLVVFEVVLGRSWGDLGRALGSVLGVFHWKTYYFVKINLFEKMSLQDATWAELGPIWVAKRLPRGGLWGLKLG